MSLTRIPCLPGSASRTGSVNRWLCLYQTIWDDFLRHCPTRVQKPRHCSWECGKYHAGRTLAPIPPKTLPTCSLMAFCPSSPQRLTSLSLSQKGAVKPSPLKIHLCRDAVHACLSTKRLCKEGLSPEDMLEHGSPDEPGMPQQTQQRLPLRLHDLLPPASEKWWHGRGNYWTPTASDCLRLGPGNDLD